MAEVIEHLHTPASRVFAYLGGFLRPAGVLLVQTPNAAALHKRIRGLTGRSAFNAAAPDPGHVHEYTPGELVDAADQTGLWVVDVSLANYLRIRRWRVPPGDWPGRCCRRGCGTGSRWSCAIAPLSAGADLGRVGDSRMRSLGPPRLSGGQRCRPSPRTHLITPAAKPARGLPRNRKGSDPMSRCDSRGLTLPVC